MQNAGKELMGYFDHLHTSNGQLQTIQTKPFMCTVN